MKKKKKKEAVMKGKGVTRNEFSKLMAIPEAKQLYEAKLLQIKLLFKDQLQLQESPGPQEPVEPGSSNIIPFPVQVNVNANAPGTAAKKQEQHRSRQKNIIKIVDASRYRDEDEEKQVEIFMDYFKNHPALRKALLDEFFLRILPYSNIELHLSQ